jgi:DNA-binding response OmpR family regulator
MPDDPKTVVLVADDEPSTLALVAGHLRARGYKVLEATDGDEAWALAHEHLPHLVVLDVMMPGMSGWEVCRKIREAVSLAHAGVVMLTGIGENLNEMTSPLYGADAYVDKPFEFSVLDAKIEETLRRRRGGMIGRTEEPSEATDAAYGGEGGAKKQRARAAKPATEKPAAAKPAARAAAKKPAAKKPAAKKPAAKKPVAKKPVAKKPVAKKPAAKKPAKKAVKATKQAARQPKRLAKKAKQLVEKAKKKAKRPAGKRAKQASASKQAPGRRGAGKVKETVRRAAERTRKKLRKA